MFEYKYVFGRLIIYSVEIILTGFDLRWVYGKNFTLICLFDTIWVRYLIMSSYFSLFNNYVPCCSYLEFL